MKRFIIIFSRLEIALIISFLIWGLMVFSGFAQTSPAAKIPDKAIKDTVIRSVSYKLYIGSRGGKYILMTSKKTGKVYKRYFKK